MLKEFFILQLKAHEKYSSAYFQHDTAPSYFQNQARQTLDKNFNPKWIGHAGFIMWLPISPDLSALDFLFQVYNKNNVYRHHPKNIQELKSYIEQTLAQVTRKMCQNPMELCVSLNG